MKNVLIYAKKGFNSHIGGIVVMFKLCRFLCETGVNAKLYSIKHTQNIICNNYYNGEFKINYDNTVIIYPEIQEGNPLNAKHVVRWILAPVGCNTKTNIVKTWGPKDLVYYYNHEQTSNDAFYKMLTVLHINPDIIDKHLFKKNCCYTVRKAERIHHKNYKFIHPVNSFEITRSHTQQNCIDFFNKYRYFVCYDPLCFYIVIAALCGCIPIVHKVAGLSKQEWLQTTAAADYLKHNNLTDLYGIAYGIDDIEYATKTIHLVKEQWNEIISYTNNTVNCFINDIQNIQNMQNTVENNYT